MSGHNKKTAWSFVLLLAGAAGVSVNYSANVCAVKGSSVTLPCTFTPMKSYIWLRKEYPLKIVRVRWCVDHLICQTTTPSVYDSIAERHDPRYEYLGDKIGNCTLQINGIQVIDNATFRFRMEADDSKGHFTGTKGVNVTVTEEVPLRINSFHDAKNRSVTLHCISNCTFHKLGVTWMKDGKPLLKSGPTLHLSMLTAKDFGNYTCALKTMNRKTSPPYYVHMEEGEGQGPPLPLIAGVLSGVLLLLLTLILLSFIFRRKQSAAMKRSEAHHMPPANIYSNVVQPAEQQEGAEREPEEDVSYVSVQFKHKNLPRPVENEMDSVIYASVVRG